MSLARAVLKIAEKLKKHDALAGSRDRVMVATHADGNPRRTSPPTLTEYAEMLELAVYSAEGLEQEY